MKKLTALVCILAIALSFCACGQAAQPAEPTPEPTPSLGDQMYEKYGSIIDKLEAEEYQAAIDEISAMLPEPEITEVTITPENFWDYYELVTNDLPYIDKDATGKITECQPAWQYYLVLKQEYQNRLVSEGSGVEIGFTGETSMRRLTLDWESGTYTLGEEATDEIRDQIISDYNRIFYWNNPYDGSISETATGAESIRLPVEQSCIGLAWHYTVNGWYYDSIYPDNEQELYGGKLVNVQIVRAEGTLVFEN